MLASEQSNEASSTQITPANYLNVPVTSHTGEKIRLSDFTGKKPVYLKIWASWCVPCREQMPHFQHSFEQYGDKVEILAINLGVNDDQEEVEQIKEEFGLTLPMATDETGKLAQAFNTLGTPFHLLIDIDGNIVHKGHDASAELDQKLALLATPGSDELTEIPLAEFQTEGEELQFDRSKPQALFFLSTWCDWYLKESRPSMSASCTQAQHAINQLQQQHPEYEWLGIASKLWTGEEEINKYQQRYNIQHPLLIDQTNGTFMKHRVRDVPTLIILNGDRELLRARRFDQLDELTAQINDLALSNEKEAPAL